MLTIAQTQQTTQIIKLRIRQATARILQILQMLLTQRILQMQTTQQTVDSLI